jgi:serine/threonine protein kinase
MARVASPAVRKVGDYVLLEPIGEGAMGTVFKGRHIATGAIAAVKLVAARVVADETLRLRFAQECQVARVLNHPHIVGMLDFGLEGSTPYLVLEYVAGESLGQRLKDQGPLAEAEAVRLIREVGQALHWAHGKKLVHRDVKPDNILVSDGGQAKLTDLGLAKSFEGNLGLTRTNTLFGTPNFMSPEQFVDAKRADAQSDMYSLAATLYMVVTGKVPFGDHSNVMKVYKKKMANAIDPPNRLVPELSKQVNDAILRGLRAERKERPASVLEFISSLPEESTIRTSARAVVRNKVKVGSIGGSDGGEGPTALRPLLKAAGVLVGGVLGALAAVLFFQHHTELAALALFSGLGLTSLLFWLAVGRNPRQQ